MDFLQPIYTELKLDLDQEKIDSYPSLQTLWNQDAIFELEMASGTREKQKLLRILHQIVLPVLRARDYKIRPFRIGNDEELVLIENPRALVLAREVAKEWRQE
jgi:hypothetical protein